MYVYMNCFNIFLVDSGGGRAKAGVKAKTRAKVRAGLKSGPEKLEIAKSSLLGALSPYAMALLGAESLSSLVEVVKLCERFF